MQTSQSSQLLFGLHDISTETARLLYNVEYRPFYRKLVTIRIKQRLRTFTTTDWFNLPLSLLKAAMLISLEMFASDPNEIFAKGNVKKIQLVTMVYKYLSNSNSSNGTSTMSFHPVLDESTVFNELIAKPGEYRFKKYDAWARLITHLSLLLSITSSDSLTRLPLDMIQYFLTFALDTTEHEKFILLQSLFVEYAVSREVVIVSNGFTSLSGVQPCDDSKPHKRAKGPATIDSDIEDKSAKSRLPTSLLSIVFTYLHLSKVLGSCYLVNQHWKYTCGLTTSYYKCEITSYNCENMKRIGTFVPQLFQYLPHLSINSKDKQLQFDSKHDQILVYGTSILQDTMA